MKTGRMNGVLRQLNMDRASALHGVGQETFDFEFFDTVDAGDAMDTGAFDQGQFVSADVGIFENGETGAFDQGQFTAADVGLPTARAEFDYHSIVRAVAPLFNTQVRREPGGAVLAPRRAPTASKMPSWVIPVGIAVAAGLYMMAQRPARSRRNR